MERNEEKVREQWRGGESRQGEREMKMRERKKERKSISRSGLEGSQDLLDGQGA